jgi:Site-specific recombinases, DNA invertase Pin homologs
MKNQTYGYARVSSKDQNLKRQLLALTGFSILQSNIFMDKKSGKDFERLEYVKLLKKLKPGDMLAVQSIDRLGRNYDEIIEQWRIITKEKGADIVILDMPLLDTRKKEQDLTSTFIADLVLQILSYVAQTERENIRKRQADGIAAALAQGVKFGRESKPLPTDFENIVCQWRSKKIRLDQALNTLNVGRTYFFQHAKLYPKTAG